MSVPRSVIADGPVKETVWLASQTPPGCFVEVGVYQGGSAYRLAQVAREQGRVLHLFDTFQGMPFADEIDPNPAGSFADTELDNVRAAIPDAVFHVGIFPATLPDDLAEIAFIHCDCDQYRSVRDVIDLLWPRVVPGGIVVFDDMDTTGGKKAIEEAFAGMLDQHMTRIYVRKPA